MTRGNRLLAEAEARRLRDLDEPHDAGSPGRCLRCGDRYVEGTRIRRFAQGWACCGEGS